jgi:hypothetical protein
MVNLKAAPTTWVVSVVILFDSVQWLKEMSAAGHRIKLAPV